MVKKFSGSQFITKGTKLGKVGGMEMGVPRKKGMDRYTDKQRPYGEIYVRDNATSDSVATATNTQVSRFSTNGQYNATTPDHTNNHITIQREGTYLVTISLAFLGDASVDWTATVYTNNGATEYPNVHMNRKLGAGGDIGSASLSGLCYFYEDDTVELWVRHGAGINKSITIQDCTLSLVKIG